jgi:hypothetical protein
MLQNTSVEYFMHYLLPHDVHPYCLYIAHQCMEYVCSGLIE